MRLVPIVLALVLTSCSYIRYEREDVSVVGLEIGVNKALSGFNYETDNAKVNIESLDNNQTDGLKALTEGITTGVLRVLDLEWT
jgi:hypothetical protein